MDDDNINKATRTARNYGTYTYSRFKKSLKLVYYTEVCNLTSITQYFLQSSSLGQ
jgi:hypothetical protein